MKKKILTVLLAVSVFSILLAGCGSEKNDVTQTEQVTEQATEKVVESTETVTEITTETVAEENTESTEAVEESPYSFTDMSATMYAQQSVNVRDLPDTNGNKVGGLSTNQEVTVTGQCNETGWYRINYNGGTAYVSDKYLGDSKVEVKQSTSSNAGNSSNSGSTQATTPSNDNGGGNSDAGSNSTASEERPSNPYPLNTLVEDTGSSISFYVLTEIGSQMLPIDLQKEANLYIMNMGKTPIIHDGTYGEFCGDYKEGSVWKYTTYY